MPGLLRSLIHLKDSGLWPLGWGTESQSGPHSKPPVLVVPWRLLNTNSLRKSRETKNSKSALHYHSFQAPGWFTAIINCHCSREVRHWQFTLTCYIFLTLFMNFYPSPVPAIFSSLFHQCFLLYQFLHILEGLAKGCFCDSYLQIYTLTWTSEPASYSSRVCCSVTDQ